mmetsp:Transcript_38527/g.89565  ORF Transcript_38527/g.89565 Transcript_38527/m.89565 type:complete len:384 (-) Transcript_38527:61-1212(-)
MSNHINVENLNMPSDVFLQIENVPRQRKKFVLQHPHCRQEYLLRVHASRALDVEQEGVVRVHHLHEVVVLGPIFERVLKHVEILRERRDLVHVFRLPYLPRHLVQHQYLIGTDVHQILLLLHRERGDGLLVDRHDRPEPIGRHGHRTPLRVLLRDPQPRHRVKLQPLPLPDLHDRDALVVALVVLLRAQEMGRLDVVLARIQVPAGDGDRQESLRVARTSARPVPVLLQRQAPGPDVVFEVDVHVEVDRAAVAAVAAGAFAVVDEGADGVDAAGASAAHLSREAFGSVLGGTGVADRYQAEAVGDVLVLELRVVHVEFDQVDGDRRDFRYHYATEGVGDGHVRVREDEVHLMGSEVGYLDLRQSLVRHRGHAARISDEKVTVF